MSQDHVADGARTHLLADLKVACRPEGERLEGFGKGCETSRRNRLRRGLRLVETDDFVLVFRCRDERVEVEPMQLHTVFLAEHHRPHFPVPAGRRAVRNLAPADARCHRAFEAHADLSAPGRDIRYPADRFLGVAAAFAHIEIAERNARNRFGDIFFSWNDGEREAAAGGAAPHAHGDSVHAFFERDGIEMVGGDKSSGGVSARFRGADLFAVRKRREPPVCADADAEGLLDIVLELCPEQRRRGRRPFAWRDGVERQALRRKAEANGAVRRLVALRNRKRPRLARPGVKAAVPYLLRGGGCDGEDEYQDRWEFHGAPDVEQTTRYPSSITGT